MRQNNNAAFTIVEAIIVISVIAIISSLAVIGYSSLRKESRDAIREGNSIVISEALEKYYDQSGEYPSVASLVNDIPSNTGAAVASKLSVPAGSLVMPNMPSATTNAITSSLDSENDYLAYEAESIEDNERCQDDPVGGCDKFTLRYIQEASESEKVIHSRRSSRSTLTAPTLSLTAANTTSINASWTTMPDAISYTLHRSLSEDMSSPVVTSHTSTSAVASELAPDTEYFFRVRATLPNGESGWSGVESATTSTIAAPTGTITITAAIIGTDARGTASGGACSAGSTIERQIRYRVNTNGWGSWAASNPRNVTAIEGYTYTFQAQARCKVGTVGGPWIQSVTASTTRSVTAPSGLTITATMVGTSARGTASGGSCATGTNIERQIRYQSTNTATAGSWSDYTAGSPRDVPASQGYRYTFQQQARCMGANASSAWVASGSAAVVRPITTAPAAPTASATTSGSTTTWSWNATTSCPTGTTARYQYRSLRDGGYTTSPWYGPYTSYTSNSWDTSLQGYQYTRQIQTHCYTVHSVGPWSGTGSKSYLRPITTPGTLTGLTHSLSSDRKKVTFSWTAPTCGPGTLPYYSWNQYGYQTTSYGWNTDWGPYGYYASTYGFGIVGGGPFPAGYKVGFRAKYKCVNTATGRQSAEGAVSSATIVTL